jgi:hypothetical protein
LRERAGKWVKIKKKTLSLADGVYGIFDLP